VGAVAFAAGQFQADKSVKRLSTPEGNPTGMQLLSPELIGKGLQL